MMNRFHKEETTKTYFSRKEFLSEKYAKLAAIQASCELETSTNDAGDLNWVWGNAELEISDGTKVVSISLDLDDYNTSINKLESIIGIATNLKIALAAMKIDYDTLEAEAKLNRDKDKVNE